MSRLKFARKHGAEPHNPSNAWSYINHGDRLVLFGAWTGLEEGERQLIFAKKWAIKSDGKRSASYRPSLRHLEHVIEDGYDLYTFRQYPDPAKLSSGPRKVKRFDPVLEKRYLAIFGDEYFALKSPTAGDPNEFLEPTDYEEGRKFSVTLNQYERNPFARAACLAHFGYSCRVCKTDFKRVYGELGTNYIHVHHLIPVSSRGTTYKVNPKTDLIPVCPNCHAMLHKENPPLKPEKLRAIVETERAKQ